MLPRRRVLQGIGVGSIAVIAGGCGSTDPSGEQGSGPNYVMVFDQTKCVGCGRCSEACNEANNLPEGESRCFVERQTDRVEGEVCPKCGKTDCNCDRKYVRVSCQQCQNSPCVMVCPTGAAYKDPATGIVSTDASKCAGCKYCIAACPYKARTINSDTKTSHQCDFCLQGELAKGNKPACVAKCKYGALVFGDANDENSYVSKLLKVKNTSRIRPHLGTEPNLHYIVKVKPEL
ncbi:4Fe-4S dicluster domain-containing protein [Ferrimonas aestuarii]|uniref:4Fe-4S dicluster domain-containing protein n=1 Tax=Ferrimonas aestuarii TaxID=2569539 RepID=A0A4U1BI51_9GAMM|nr:4Fe-4S dicluster domain-containing protein [Ferrimonas aestuarii]TKB50202.1 4Fe-4S dicluster domain-containing protein [Ferrimonas aestuarii]